MMLNVITIIILHFTFYMLFGCVAVLINYCCSFVKVMSYLKYLLHITYTVDDVKDLLLLTE